MSYSRFVLRLLEHAESCGVPEEVVGDLLEEMGGRSRGWMCRQLIGLGSFVVVAQVRERTRLTPRGVAIGLSALMLAGVSMMPVSRVLEAWLVFYGVTGILSLFAHMAAEGQPAEVSEGDVDSRAD